jgi:hypothetical protein
MRLFHLPLLAALAGCSTLVPLPGPGEPEVRLLVQRADRELGALLADIADRVTVPDYAAAAAALEVARVKVATDAILAGADFGLAGQAERAALGVTLTLCAEGVAKMARLSKAEAARQAQGVFGVSCVVPLRVLAVR